MNNNFFTRTVPAGQAVIISAPGRVLSVKTSTLPLTVALDGKEAQPVQSGTVLPGPFNSLNFFNASAVDVTVSFYVGDAAVLFSPQDNQQASASTYVYGNLGIATGAGAAGGNPACDGNGFLQITNAMALPVPGTNNGHRRQTITFALSGQSPASLNVLDASGRAFMTILAGQQIALDTDAALVLSGAGGTAWVTVGQIFLSA